ncbi:vWA domain-containing protein [uncultured Parabacteroides sp.]|uniref:vWA domain-containing protein n=1 Tax=uncultured Parabacteroides sp. TaxID=512312 RepID=UPI00263783CC|nr:vWA domain-containing protein [uncultured Parabacteroides sp.]
MKIFFHITSIMFFMIAAVFTSCIDSGDDTIILESGNSTGIPDDSLADENPSISTPTTSIPNIQYTVETDGADAIVRIDMTGIQDANSYDWLRLVGTAQSGQNIWLSVDGMPKGILVYNNADDNEEDQELAADLVFIVDNSGSMQQEADAIARDIVSWAQTLSASSLDIQFGCVGYSENGRINGAINLTDVNSLSAYLNRSTGTGRTKGFSGSDASVLSNAASGYSVSDECGGMALRYADANISFRTGANRIYVNFTDEPNQASGKQQYSVEYFASQANWNTNQGTVHTVYSADTTFTESRYSREKPWRISQYTGGTTLIAPSDFSGVTLENLPVTGAMTNSYIIRFTNIREFMDGKSHLVKITILSEDGKTRAERAFYMTFGTNNQE